MWMQVALLNGITMGGGAGVSIPGTFRVATDKTVRNKQSWTSFHFSFCKTLLSIADAVSAWPISHEWLVKTLRLCMLDKKIVGEDPHVNWVSRLDVKRVLKEHSRIALNSKMDYMIACEHLNVMICVLFYSCEYVLDRLCILIITINGAESLLQYL